MTEQNQNSRVHQPEQGNQGSISQQHEQRRVAPGAITTGLVLIALGVVFLIGNLVPDLKFDRLWPIAIIVWGFAVLVGGFIPPVSFARLMRGMLIGTVGVIFLNNTLGFLPYSFWFDLLSLWPVFLIAAGVAILGGASGSRVISAMPSLIIVGALLAAFFYHGSIFQDRAPQAFSYEREADSGIVKGVATIQAVAGKIEVGVTDKLYEVSGRSAAKAKDKYPKVEFEQSGSEVRLNVTPPQGFIVMNAGRNRSWDVLLSKDVEWVINTGAGLSSAEIDLSALKVREFRLDGGIGEMKIKLGDRRDRVTATIEAGIASLRVEAPKSSGVRLTIKEGLSSTNFKGLDLRRVREDDVRVYETPGFSAASKQVEINADVGISSVTIEGY